MERKKPVNLLNGNFLRPEMRKNVKISMEITSNSKQSSSQDNEKAKKLH